MRMTLTGHVGWKPLASVVADVALSYIDLQSFQTRLAITWRHQA